MPIIPIIVVTLALVGFLGHMGTIFIIGAILGIFVDIWGILRGKLNPLFPLFLYAGGYIYFGDWYGILWGAVIGSAIEVLFLIIMLLGGGTYTIVETLKKKPGKSEDSEEESV